MGGHGTCRRGEGRSNQILESAKWNLSAHDSLWAATNIQRFFNFQWWYCTRCFRIFWEVNNASLTNVSVDGVSYCDYFTWTLSWNFLKDKASHTAITDPHHNFNNFWYQLIGGSGCNVIGIYIINTHLLIIVHVSINLWRIIDYVSNLLVLNMALYNTLCKLWRISPTEDDGSVGAICVTLYFVILSFYATNSNKCGFHYRYDLLFFNFNYFLF